MGTKEELVYLVADACYLLNLEADEQLSREEYERWRDRWIGEAQQTLGAALKEVCYE